MGSHTTQTQRRSRFRVKLSGVLNFQDGERWTKEPFSIHHCQNFLINWIVILNCRVLKTASGSNNFLTHCKSYPHTKEPGVLRGYFAALMVRNSVKGELCMCKHNTKRAVLLDVVPERRTKRYSPRFRPSDRFCEPSFRYLLPGSEGGKCRPLDQRKQIPLIHSVRLISSDNFYIYRTYDYFKAVHTRFQASKS